MLTKKMPRTLTNSSVSIRLCTLDLKRFVTKTLYASFKIEMNSDEEIVICNNFKTILHLTGC